MTWLTHNWTQVLTLGWAHLGIAIPAIVLSLVASIVLGWVAHRYRVIHGPLLGILGVLYAVPSLPLLIVVPALIGTGLRSPVNMVLVLTLYGIAILVRQVSDAFDAVPEHVTESATAAGFGAWRKFWQIDLPLTIPIVTAGVRVVVVSTISLVTVGAVIGVRSLGTLFTDGFQRGIVGEVVTGLIATVALALVLDGVVVFLSGLLTPWRRRGRSRATSQAGVAA